MPGFNITVNIQHNTHKNKKGNMNLKYSKIIIFFYQSVKINQRFINDHILSPDYKVTLCIHRVTEKEWMDLKKKTIIFNE